VKATGNDPDELGEGCFLDAAKRARTSDRWRYREIDTNHMLLSNRPKEVTDLLVELA
jgi:hypothetical protein